MDDRCVPGCGAGAGAAAPGTVATQAPTSELDDCAGAQLVVLAGVHAGRRIPIRGETVVGRSGSAMVCLPDPHISRQHVRIWRGDDGEFSLQDLGSHNGTAINGCPVGTEPQRLAFGDRIRIGQASLLLLTRYDDIEDQVLRSQRLEALGQLAGGLVHELNNLLAVVLGNVDFINLSTTTPDASSSLEDIRTAAERAAGLIRQLYRFSSAGPSVHRIIDLSRLTQEVCQLAQRTFGRAIQLQTVIEPDLNLVGDSASLHQMLMNLLINGRDALPDGGALTISLQRLEPEQSAGVLTHEGPGIRLSVEDNGPGMDEDAVQRALEPYFAEGPGQAGGGLGLSTVYRIVQSHGGRIAVESGREAGSCFRVDLPLVEPQQEREIARTRVLVTDARGTVLVVEPERLVASSLARLLRSLGYKNRWVASFDVAEQAIQELAAADLCLIVLDATLLQPGGANSVAALRALTAVPILLTSGLDHDLSLQRLSESGVVDWLRKPFSGRALKDALDRALGTPAD